MKAFLLILVLFSFSLAADAQTDSTKIAQTVTLKQKHVLHFLASMDWAQPEVINVLNAYRVQHDSVNYEKNITLTIPSNLIAEGMQRLSQLPEGIATQFNEDMAAAIFPQLSNAWLLNRMLQTRSANFAARDTRNKNTAIRIEKINKLQ